MPGYDWEKIRQEYVADPTTSFRKLAAKYGISNSALNRRGVLEKWTEQRKQYQAKQAAEYEGALLSQARDAAHAVIMAREALAKKAMIMAERAQRPSDMIQIASTLQILSKMMGIQSEQDDKEQKARIAAMESRVGTQEEDEGTGVIVITEKGKEDNEE